METIKVEARVLSDEEMKNLASNASDVIKANTFPGFDPSHAANYTELSQVGEQLKGMVNDSEMNGFGMTQQILEVSENVINNYDDNGKIVVEDNLDGIIDTDGVAALQESITPEDRLDVLNIKRQEDQMPKYDVENIKEVNEKLKGVFSDTPIDVDSDEEVPLTEEETAKVVEFASRFSHDETVKIGGNVYQKRTANDYNILWEYFVAHEEEDFRKIMGYDKKRIKKIGIRKFIDAMDWKKVEDVRKYKTDAYHVVICPHCKSAFGIYETNVGLCDRCAEGYDMPRFYNTYNEVMKVNAKEALDMPRLFFAFDEFRNKYKKLTIEDRVKQCREEKFIGVETFRLLMDLMALSIQENGDTNEAYVAFKNNVNGMLVNKKRKPEGIITTLFDDVDENGDWKNQIHEKLVVMLKEWNK